MEKHSSGIAVEMIPAAAVGEWLYDIQPMIENELSRERPLYSWDLVVEDLLNGRTNLIVVIRDGQTVACCGWKMVQYPMGVVARVGWFAAHEWEPIKEKFTAEIEQLFKNMGADFVELWTRPGLGKFLKSRGMQKYEEGFTKRISE